MYWHETHTARIYSLYQALRGIIMGEDINLIDQLRARIRELENKVEALRISRRVLMNLIDALERDKREQILRLEARNERLQRSNSRYAQALMYRNIRISQLENQLNLLVSGNNNDRRSST